MINYFYNIIIKEDDCDLYSDVLTGIRKDFYLSREKQKGKITQDSSGDTLFYEFNLEKDKSIKWQVSDEESILSDSKNIEDGKYCINYYDYNGISKVLTFSKYHTLLKVEYFNKLRSNTPYCVIEPRKANNDLCLLISSKSSFGSVVLFAMPQVDDEYIQDKVDSEFTDYTAVASTNAGVVKFLSNEQLELFEEFIDRATAMKLTDTLPQSFIDSDDAVLASRLNPKDFNVKRNLSEAVDITQAQEFSFSLDDDYMDDDSVEMQDDIQSDTLDIQVLDVDATLSAFLEEASAPQTTVEAPADGDYCEVETTDNDALDEPVDDTPTVENDDFAVSIPADDDFETPESVQNPDLFIESSNTKYLYYGETDSNGKRHGYGRTATENGHTAYEGNYADNKRNGLGSYYYKDGMLCYFGEWKNNKREGFGVGVSSFDNSVHVGKFSNNKPIADGVRLSSDGEIKFVKRTLTNGVSVVIEFDKDKIIVSKYNEDGELISENTSNMMYF